MSNKEEFAKLWLETGGFVTQKIAAEILNVSKGRISQMIIEGKIKAYKPDTDKMPYIKSVLEYEPKEQMKRTKNHEYPRNQTQKDK